MFKSIFYSSYRNSIVIEDTRFTYLEPLKSHLNIYSKLFRVKAIIKCYTFYKQNVSDALARYFYSCGYHGFISCFKYDEYEMGKYLCCVKRKLDYLHKTRKI